MNNLTLLLQLCARQSKTLELYDHDYKLIGTITPELLDITKIVITQNAQLSEKFCFYYSGIAFFFSYYKTKLAKN